MQQLIDAVSVRRWQARATQLERLLESHVALGFRSKREMLEEAARQSGRKASTLRTEIAALRTARELDFPDILDPACGTRSALIAYFKRLKSLNPEAAEAVKHSVWAGDISVARLRALIENSVEAGALPRARPETPARGSAHGRELERRVGQKLLERAPVLLGEKTVRLEEGPVGVDLPVDFLAYSGDHVIASFEVKAGSANFGKRRVIDLLARAVLHQKAYKRAWIIVERSPDWASVFIHYLRLIRSLELEHIYLAFYDLQNDKIEMFEHPPA